ncbi:MAG: ATP-binding protein [Lachnospiraceae bacterium]|nr:ATP-binding protein [Lachnospiraceae bacterium]
MHPILIVLCVLLGAALTLLAAVCLRRGLYSLIDRRIERFQSELIEKQVCEIENMYRQVRGWRHDYRNHIQNMKIQLDERSYDALERYLNELADDLNSVDTVLKTGNVMADAILNSKLAVAEQQQIRLNVKASIPEKLPMSDVELCSVLGNMLDNAVEACAALPEDKRFLRVYIGKLKGQFYLSVQNSAGRVRKEKGTYLSTKKETGGEKRHGYGLFRIDRVAKKYGGYVNRQNEEGVFATELLFPLPAEPPSSAQTAL